MAGFQALVRFDVGGGRIHVSVGGCVEPDAVDELCELIERSVSIAGRSARVDLSGAAISAQTLDDVVGRCGDVAQIDAGTRGEG
jgi:hypothetical protein